MKKILLPIILLLSNILYAEGYYSPQDMVSYQDLQREISGIGVISDKTRIQKLNLGEVNPVVMKEFENYLSNYFDKKFKMLKLEINTNIRKIQAALDKKQSEELQLVLNKLYKFKFKLNNIQFQIQKININTDYYKQVFNLYQTEFNKLTNELQKLEIYVNNNNNLVIDPFSEEAYKNKIMNLYISKTNFKYLKSNSFKNQMKSNNKVLYNSGINSITNSNINLLDNTIYNKRKEIIVGAENKNINTKIQLKSGLKISKRVIPKTLKNSSFIKLGENGINVPYNDNIRNKEKLNEYYRKQKIQPPVKQEENSFLPSFVK